VGSGKGRRWSGSCGPSPWGWEPAGCRRCTSRRASVYGSPERRRCRIAGCGATGTPWWEQHTTADCAPHRQQRGAGSRADGPRALTAKSQGQIKGHVLHGAQGGLGKDDSNLYQIGVSGGSKAALLQRQWKPGSRGLEFLQAIAQAAYLEVLVAFLPLPPAPLFCGLALRNSSASGLGSPCRAQPCLATLGSPAVASAQAVGHRPGSGSRLSLKVLAA
jgi:hypothetical protein